MRRPNVLGGTGAKTLTVSLSNNETEEEFNRKTPAKSN